MRWCFGIGAVHLGTSAQTQVASGYFGVLWQYPSALVLAVRDMLGKASRTLSGAADKNILVLQALPHSAPSTVATAGFPTYMHKKMIHKFLFCWHVPASWHIVQRCCSLYSLPLLGLSSSAIVFSPIFTNSHCTARSSRSL